MSTEHKRIEEEKNDFSLDQYYTKPSVVHYCVSQLVEHNTASLLLDDFHVVLDPAAGSGVFLEALICILEKHVGVYTNSNKLCLYGPNRDPSEGVLRLNWGLKTTFINIDLEPVKKECICIGLLDKAKQNIPIFKLNFLDLNVSSPTPLKFLFIGNPPYGFRSNKAFKIMNHITNNFNSCAGSIMAFILPLSFKKKSFLNKISFNWHLEQIIDLPSNSFIYNGKDYHVPTAFFIFVKKKGPLLCPSTLKELQAKLSYNGITFIKKPTTHFDGYCLAVRRIGFYAGTAYLNYEVCHYSSHYFLLIKNKESFNKLLNFLNHYSFKECNYVVGPRSISKPELIDVCLLALKT